MTDTRRTQKGTGAGGRSRNPREPEPTAWTGWIVFAGIMMFIVGLFEAIEGLVALLRDDYYLVPRSDLVVSVDYTTWGWVHLLLGILVAAAGLGVIRGLMWARIAGVAVAMLSAVVHIAFLRAFPVWSIINISIDVLVIYALTVHGDEAKAAYHL